MILNFLVSWDSKDAIYSLLARDHEDPSQRGKEAVRVAATSVSPIGLLSLTTIEGHL
jgi:hypothetical protein